MASSSSAPYASSSLSNIAAIVRRANERVSRLAAAVRTSLTPTHHAKRRARKLKLRVNIEDALKLDPKYVSTVPLPVLATPPPLPIKHHHQHQQQIVPLTLAPVYHEPVVFRENEISRAAAGRQLELLCTRAHATTRRPALRCQMPSDIVAPGDASFLSTTAASSALSDFEPETPADEVEVHAPVVLRGQNVPWRPVTSRWSVSTVASEDQSEDADIDIDVNVEDADIAEAAGVYNDEDQDQDQEWHSHAYDGSMDLPIAVSPDSPTGPYGELEYTQPCRHLQALRTNVELDIGGDTRRVLRGGPRHLKVPLRMDTDMDVDMGRLSWGSSSSAYASSSSGSQSASSESGSSSTSASSVESPASSRPKLMIRIKRSIPVDLDAADSEDTHSLSEKRPKYGRKLWATPYPAPADRRQSIRISALTNMNTNQTTTNMTHRSSNRF